MFVEERQNLILEDLQENGKVLVKDLSKRFGVTPDLIRKDLAFLESKGKCKKIYGGAILNRLNVHLEDANSRKNVNSKEKQKIAQTSQSGGNGQTRCIVRRRHTVPNGQKNLR